jgi:hypothetical protein
MYAIQSEDMLQEVLARGQGFLINKWGRIIKVHDLQHLCNGCRTTLGFTSQYPKFFAENTQAIDEKWGNNNWDFCPRCQ